jgi:hypothetical protein
MSTAVHPVSEQSLDAALAAWFGVTKVMPEREILRDRMRAAIEAAGVHLTLPPLNPSMVEILGRVCFQCIGIAQILRAGGAVIPTRAEDEQAATIHFLLGMYLAHGERWTNEVDAALQKIVEARAARQTGREG